MRYARVFLWSLLAGCLVLSAFGLRACRGAEALPFPTLPDEWHVQQTVTVPPANLPALGQKFGAKITAISNTILDAEGERLQVNLIECASEGDAAKAAAAIRAMKPSPAYCLQFRTRVVEFLCRDLRLVLKAPYALGLRPSSTAYRISFTVATVEKCDYMKTTPLFNAFLNQQAHPDSPAARDAVARNARGFTFGNTLALRTLGSDGQPIEYAFSAMPENTTAFAAGDGARYAFRRLPAEQGVPYVKVSARITARAFTATPTTRTPDAALLDATRFWPSDDPEMIALARQITAGRTATEEKAWAILEWLQPGKHLKFGGAEIGSRYGTAQFLQQGYGHCWDFSDLFITLCRAAGVPCRQVGGWLVGQSGHVWAEVLLPEQGWLQVDPTAGSACGTDHLAYFTSEGGEMPIVYLAMPEIEEETAE
ncbi:MAG: transglutaminase-like domain-containing protein [Armatimonadota bacterium]